jgi:hypothetical protein
MVFSFSERWEALGRDLIIAEKGVPSSDGGGNFLRMGEIFYALRLPQEKMLKIPPFLLTPPIPLCYNTSCRIV